MFMFIYTSLPISLPKYSCSLLVPSITVLGYNFISSTNVLNKDGK